MMETFFPFGMRTGYFPPAFICFRVLTGGFLGNGAFCGSGGTTHARYALNFRDCDSVTCVTGASAHSMKFYIQRACIHPSDFCMGCLGSGLILSTAF
jgi:hypothetical protein